MVYVCDEHKVAFVKETSAKAHWNFQHEKGDNWVAVDKDAIMQEETPEGYVLKAVPAREAIAKVTAGEAPPRTPAAPELNLEEDPEAKKLGDMLDAIGVPAHEILRVINGFVNIPRIRSDPNYLSHWLDTHIRADKALKAYIPMIVQDVLGQDGGTIPLPLGPDGSGTPRYFAPGYPNYTGYPFTRELPYFPPPPQKDPETTESIKLLNQKFESVLGIMQADREDRKREEKEREQKEKEQQINAKIDKVQETVLDFIKGSSKEGVESKTEAQIATLMTEIKEMRTDQQKQALEAVLSEVTALRQAVASVKGEVTGRSTEDLVHDLGPLALDKFDKIGERLQNELKGLREQIGPGVKEKLDEAAQAPRSIEVIEDQVATENNIVGLASGVEVRAEGEQPAEKPAAGEPYARMPSRRRRAQRGGEQNDEVSGVATPSATP